ncbi:ABC transporter permease [Agrococcus casei]|uniref:ABC transporter, permease protein n=1 Tax=Agrococcus casei LMG 22410 TaxID=1255656 RepID=A0A1R4FDH2_9MICO|nr:ABC transporter permease [Agrococcus casei]SJM53842.1 ABC transporter, permease protein [Agrococcus casei LMG 22410]
MSSEAPSTDTSKAAEGTHQPDTEVHLERVVVRKWRPAIALAALTVVAFVLTVGFGTDESTTFSFAKGSDFFSIPAVALGVRVIGIVSTLVMAAITGIAVWRTLARKRVWGWLYVVFGAFFAVDFLTWAGSGSQFSFTDLMISTVALSVPLIFGALGGVISERAGIVNIAIEAQLLSGAFSGALVASITGNTYVGLLAAMVAGMLVSFVLAAFAIKYLVEQVIVGVVLNVLVVGLTGFFYSSVLSSSPELNNPDRLPAIALPLLSKIPVIGPTLFNQTIIVYAMYVAVVVITWAMFNSTWGLRLRSLGEHPLAADTVGIKVGRWRFWNVSLAGAIAGLGGAYFTLDQTGQFTKEMTGGLGYIALAAVIFGKWHPLKATFAALLFGFARALQQTLSAAGSQVPSEVLLMLPYVITILAVTGFIGLSRAPAASGKPYAKQ